MLKTLFEKLGASAKQEISSKPETDPTQLAFAALLVEVARSDEDYTDKEATLISSLLARQFELPAAEAALLRSAGEEAQNNASDIYQFSSVLKNTFTAAEKISFLENMWEVILSDDHKDPYEEMIMRRLGGLIHVTDQENHAARLRVETKNL